MQSARTTCRRGDVPDESACVLLLDLSHFRTGSVHAAYMQLSTVKWQYVASSNATFLLFHSLMHDAYMHVCCDFGTIHWCAVVMSRTCVPPCNALQLLARPRRLSPLHGTGLRIYIDMGVCRGGTRGAMGQFSRRSCPRPHRSRREYQPATTRGEEVDTLGAASTGRHVLLPVPTH